MRQLLREGKVQQALHKVERFQVRSQTRQRAKHELITYLMNPAVGGTNVWIILGIVLWGYR